MLPTDRPSFKAYCLRALGDGAIQVNVTDEQLDDRVDEALSLWQDYHMEGTSKQYYKYILTPQDIQNQYISLPAGIIGAVNIFDLGDVYGMQNIFNIRYQIALNDLYTLTSVSMVPYYMALAHLQFMEMILVGKQFFRYSRIDNKFYIDMDWTMVYAGQYIVIEVYQIWPENTPMVWQDYWLRRYATALIKRQWGNNLKKYAQMKLPDGNLIAGQQIYNESEIEIKELRQELVDTWALPALDQIY